MKITLTQKQISDMKHAIGYAPDMVKKGKYKAYRNYFAVGEENESWEELVKNEVATKRTRFGDTVYHLSVKGISILSDILGITIIESI